MVLQQKHGVIFYVLSRTAEKTPHPDYERVVCNNSTCKRNMLVSRCQAKNEEGLRTNKEDDTKQIKIVYLMQHLLMLLTWVTEKVKLRMIYCHLKKLWHNLQQQNDCYI